MNEALEGQSRAADHKLLTSALRYIGHPRPPQKVSPDPNPDKTQETPQPANTAINHLTFIGRSMQHSSHGD